MLVDAVNSNAGVTYQTNMLSSILSNTEVLDSKVSNTYANLCRRDAKRTLYGRKRRAKNLSRTLLEDKRDPKKNPGSPVVVHKVGR